MLLLPSPLLFAVVAVFALIRPQNVVVALTSNELARLIVFGEQQPSSHSLLLNFDQFMGQGHHSKPEQMASAIEFVNKAIASKAVVVFSKSYCPYCHKAKAALSSFAISADELEWIELDKRPDLDMAAIQDYLATLTGARSVPRVFIGGKFVGGGDDMVAAKKSGQLQKWLLEAKAIRGDK